MNGIQTAAAKAIVKEAHKNKFITPDSIRQEAIDGDIGGWMYLSAVTACNFNDWTSAMFQAAFMLETE